ncbi:MAG: hypothetical protein JRN15_18530 [Nitrososphaerota archaeon]|nr:hypothetical protein [Nitrososphaerota archaeon]
MGEDFLKKAKGFTRTFVIHSNVNPCAAVAAMGMVAARNQEAGAYLRPSDTFVPMVEGLAPEELNSAPAADQIEVDFKSDWVAYLRKAGLPACGLKYRDNRSPEENTMRFLNAYNRRIPATKPRAVHESRELTIPPQYRKNYNALVALIKAGGDLKPYLSRHIVKRKRPDWNDGLLNSWGIQHLHFRIEGTDHLLFCIITVSEVFLIQTLPHVAEHWVNTQLVQILHDNWPEMITRARHTGLKPEVFSAAERQSLRGYNANFPITVADGTIYLPLTGGTMASGDSVEDRVNCDKIFHELRFWQGTVALNVFAIRSALKMTDAKKLIVRMAFDNRDCCFYEPTQAVRLGGFVAALVNAN